MTTIVGIQGKGWGLIAADSLMVSGSQKFIANGMDKVIEKGEYVFAFAGDAIAGDIANFCWIPPKLPKVVNLDKFMMTDLMPSLRQAFTDYGYDPSPKKEDGMPNEDAGFDALICVRGKIYQIDNDFSWCRDDRGVYAVGSGGSYALGSLSRANISPTSTKVAVNEAKKAIEISASFDINTGGKTKIITQRGKDMPKVGKKEYAYTAKGMAMAKADAKKSGKKMVMKKAKKRGGKKK